LFTSALCFHAFSYVAILFDFKGNKGTIRGTMKPVKLIPKKTPKGWRVNIPHHLSNSGKRQRLFFASRDEAERHAAPLREKVRAGDIERILPPEQARFAHRAFVVLEGLPPEVIVEAARDYVKKHDLAANSRKLGLVWSDYIERASSDHASDRHLKNLARTGKRFAPLAETLVCFITATEIERILKGASASYRNAILREARSVFNFAVARKWSVSNPSEEIDFKQRKLSEAEIYTTAECAQIMAACADRHPELVPAFTAMLFCGVRPDHADGEITKLRWDHILFGQEKRVAMPSDITKTGKRRSVNLRANAAAWLKWHIAQGGDHTGLVVAEKGTPFRDRVREIFTESKVKRIQDGLRKSFCSYVVPIDGLDEAERELGHAGGRELMNRHYRQDVTAKDARLFWKVVPPKVSGKILAFTREAA